MNYFATQISTKTINIWVYLEQPLPPLVTVDNL